MKQRLFTIAILASGASLLLLLLNMTSANPNHSKNGFNRTFLKSQITPADTAAFESHFRSICGYDDNAIYFESEIPGAILKSSFDFEELDTFQLTLPYIKNIRPMFTTVVEFPEIYIAAGNAKVMISGNLVKDSAEVFATPFQFRRGVFYDTNKAIMEIFGDNMKSSFITYDLSKGKQTNQKEFFGSENHSGFTHDGIFEYDPANGTFLFLTYYANQVYHVDTALRLLYKAHTIDTNSVSSAHVVRQGSHVKQESAPTFVNNMFTVSGGIVYVLSNLKSDNQMDEQDIVLDLYEIERFAYIGSIVVPRFEREKLKSIRIFDGYIYTLFSKHIVRYILDTKIFKDLLQ